MARRAIKLQHANLPQLLLQARERVISYFRPILNAHGMTEQQWRIVRVLLEVDTLEPRQICEVCCISSPSLVGVLARMQQLGLILRKPVAHDQRRVLVCLTPRARALAEDMVPQIEAAYARIEASIGRQFVGQLHATLVQLLGSLEPASVDVADADEESPRARTGTARASVR